jgi:hypothetical protein
MSARSVIVVDRNDLERLTLRAAYAAYDQSSWPNILTAERAVSLFLSELRHRQGPAFTKIAKPAIEDAARAA